MMRSQPNRHARSQNNNKNNNTRNHNRNLLNKHYESNGSDVKIRGSAQHIVEKYTALARDANAAGDHVMAENYLQHAEHYNRLILAATSQMQQQQANREEKQNHEKRDKQKLNEQNHLENDTIKPKNIAILNDNSDNSHFEQEQQNSTTPSKDEFEKTKQTRIKKSRKKYEREPDLDTNEIGQNLEINVMQDTDENHKKTNTEVKTPKMAKNEIVEIAEKTPRKTRSKVQNKDIDKSKPKKIKEPKILQDA